jgi:hypothetical protein
MGADFIARIGPGMGDLPQKEKKAERLTALGP